MAKKVLIIDDDLDITDSLRMVLESKGYHVESANTAKGVVELALRVLPDLIILDVMFPEDSSEGFDAARSLAQEPTTAKIPVLMLSAVNSRFNLGFSNKDRDSSWLPVAEFIEKPIEPAKLLSVVSRLTQ